MCQINKTQKHNAPLCVFLTRRESCNRKKDTGRKKMQISPLKRGRWGDKWMTPVVMGGAKTHQTNQNGGETERREEKMFLNTAPTLWKTKKKLSIRMNKKKFYLEECEQQFVCRTSRISYLGNHVLPGRVLIPGVAMIDSFFNLHLFLLGFNPQLLSLLFWLLSFAQRNHLR